VTTSGLGTEVFTSGGSVNFAQVQASLPCDQIWRDGHPCLGRGVPHNFLAGLALEDQFCQCECFCKDLGGEVDGEQVCAKVGAPTDALCTADPSIAGCPLAGVGGELNSLQNLTLFNEIGGCLENADFPRNNDFWVQYGASCEHSLNPCELVCYESCLKDDVCNAAFLQYTQWRIGSRYPNNRTMDAVSFYHNLTMTEDVFSESYAVGRFFSCMDAAFFTCEVGGQFVKTNQNKVSYADGKIRVESDLPKSGSSAQYVSTSAVVAALLALFANR